MQSAIAFLKSFLTLFILLSVSFIANVYVHEMGHFMAAQALGLTPTLHVLNPAQNGITAFAAMEPVAYVQFSEPANNWTHFTIAVSGVIWNIILALLITYLFAHVKKTPASSMLYLALVLPSILSVLINLNILSPISDGSLMMDLFVQTLK